MKSLLDGMAGYDYILVDAMNMSARNHFGVRVEQDGFPTGMMYGVMKFILTCRRLYPDSKLLFLWEGYGNIKKEKYPFYKAQRRQKDSLFDHALHYTKQLIESSGYDQMWCVGSEADDLAAWLALVKYKDSDVLLVSGDEDWLQYMRKGRVDIRVRDMVYTYSDMEAKHGFPPERVGIFKVLTGDQSDNIYGIPMFPTKLAVLLAKACSAYEELFTVDMPFPTWPKWRDVIAANEEIIRRNADLILFDPESVVESRIETVSGSCNSEIVFSILERFEMRKTIEYLKESGLFGD
jgi:5'-3' exonuclease